MTDSQSWALAAAVVAGLFVVLRFVRLERQAQRRATARELLHRERMAAIDRNLQPPADASPARSAAAPRWESTILGLGLVLLCTGLGFMLGLRLVPRTPEMLGMQELASLGLIPALAGAGFLFYWFLLGRSSGGAS